MAIETTLTSAKAWHPDLSSFAPTDVVPEAIILQTSTVSGRIEGDEPVLRVAYVDDAAAQFVAEGTEIPEADPVLSEAVVATGKIATLVRLSREQWHTLDTSELLSDSVSRAVIVKANEAYLAQPKPTAPAVTPPGGLRNLTGIVDGGAVAANLDKLVDLVATLEGNGATPSHWVLSPTAWASLRKFKSATGSAASLLGAGVTDAQRVLLDLPVLVTPAMAAGAGMLLDKTAIVSAVGDVVVASSGHQYFSADSIALRCTWRIGWNAVRPNRLAKFTVTAPA